MNKYNEPNFENYNDKMIRLFPKKFPSTSSVLTLTFQVTEDCCMACTYCYQNKKSQNKMNFNTAKQIIDNLLLDDSYYNTEKVNGIILEFIGGEPLMEITLINQIVDYYFQKSIELNHRFLYKTMISMASNGLLYFEPEVQKFIKKYNNILSYTVSIDGNKELHDSCRVDLEGNGTYDRAIAAAMDRKNSNNLETKMTLSPDNISYIFDAIKNLISLGYISISLNYVYEEGWNINHAKILYNELKKVADWLFETDSFKKYRISLFNEDLFTPLPLEENNNWCGGVCNGMLSFDYTGNAFPCIRYMNSSLNDKQLPYSIGTIDGLFQTEKEKERYNILSSITRSSQSTKECLECPVAKGCGWCSGYNYEYFGTPNKRATFICWMHKARSLINSYYYNKGYYLLNENNRVKIYLSENDALQIISKEEWEELKFYENTMFKYN